MDLGTLWVTVKVNLNTIWLVFAIAFIMTVLVLLFVTSWITSITFKHFRDSIPKIEEVVALSNTDPAQAQEKYHTLRQERLVLDKKLRFWKRIQRIFTWILYIEAAGSILYDIAIITGLLK